MSVQIIEKKWLPLEELKREKVVGKSLEVPIGGATFTFEVPENPMVYVSETEGVLYVNGSAYWESELYILEDLKTEFLEQVEELAHAVGSSVSKVSDEPVSLDEYMEVERRNFHIRVNNMDVGFYYDLFRPNGLRNGLIRIVPYIRDKSLEH